MSGSAITAVEKLETGIPGFEHVSVGGLPKGRTCLLSGTAGSSKTVFAVQFLVEGIRRGEGGVFVTFEESPENIMSNMLSFGWNLEQFVGDGKLAFVDASPQPEQELVEAGSYDLGALLARIEYAVGKVQGQRVSVDSLGAVFSQFSDVATVRGELYRMAVALKKMAVTALLTAERTEEYGPLARFGVEEFVADNVIILRNVLDDEKRRRTLEILKFRGTDHAKGEFPFTVIPGEGVVIIPLSETKLEQKSSTLRVTSGNHTLDEMCGGGFFRDSIILVSGATGCGKTLLVTAFVSGAQKPDDRCLLFAFEESREQLFRNASGWGMDFETMEQEGRLKVVCVYPEVMGLEDHLIRMKKEIRAFKPTRVAVDSLSALERVSTGKSFREFVIGITSFIKHQEIVGLFSSTTPTLLGGASITEEHISTITDSILLLRYVEMFGEMRRGITVLKMRGSMHDKGIREYAIDGQGMHIGAQFHGIAGILSGQPMQISQPEIERMGSLFREELGE